MTTKPTDRELIKQLQALLDATSSESDRYCRENPNATEQAIADHRYSCFSQVSNYFWPIADRIRARPIKYWGLNDHKWQESTMRRFVTACTNNGWLSDVLQEIDYTPPPPMHTTSHNHKP